MGRKIAPLFFGEVVMRIVKRWTGIFHCPICQLEVELLDDDSVECQGCGERLIPGPLFSEDDDTERV
jgi:DNA-directed RNA polymerase subunit RPC12/RpoP